MRIGIITGEYPPLQGGVAAFSDILAHRLQKLGHDIFVFSDSRTKQQSDLVLVTTFDESWGYTALRAIQSWIDENRLDIVNLQFQTAAYNMSPWIHFYPQFIKVPFVTTFHDLRFPYLFPKAGFLRDWIVMHLAKVSNRIIVTNHEDFARIEDLPFASLIPIGSNILSETNINRSEWRKKMGVSDSDFLIAHFGFINHSKGVDTLLKAQASFNDTVKLVMIGGRTGTADPTNAAYAESIDRLIIELGLENRVTWTGFVNDNEVSAYLAATDAVVMPFRDGASFRRSSLMAAIHHACAIISTTSRVEIPEFENERILLVSPDDNQALAEAINRLKESPELCDTLRKNVQELRHYFDWDVIATDTLRIFEQALGEKTP
jgi:glycosyltransferase involved in cell wall biosynthesis